MLRKIMLAATAMSALAACSDQQVREMAQVGTEDGKPVYMVETRVRLPASQEKIKSLQDSTLEARGKRLCPGGYREIGRTEPYKDEYYYNTYPYGGGWGLWDFNHNTYDVLKQGVQIICTT